MSADLEEFAAHVVNGDETSVGLGPVADTAVVEVVDYPETPLAWSLDDEPEPPAVKPKPKPKAAKPKPAPPPKPVPYSWSEVGVMAGVGVSCALVLALVVAFAGLILLGRANNGGDGWTQPGVEWTPSSPSTTADSAPPATVPSTMPPSPPRTTPPTPSATVTQGPSAAPTAAPTPATTPAAADRDRQYLADLRAAGITITDPGRVAGNGPRICAYIAAGHTEQQAVETAMAGNPTLTRNNAITVVDAAIAVYCPDEN